MQLRRSFWGVLVILAAGILAAFFLPVLAPNFPADSIAVPYRLIYICLLLIIISWVWAVVSIQGVAVRRVGRGFRQQLGEVFEERFEIANRFPIVRVWMEVKDKSNLPGTSGSRVFSWIGSRETRSYSSYTLLTRRGEYVLGPTEIYSGDPFGLFSFRRIFKQQNKVLVMPYMVHLSSFPYPPGYLTGGKALRVRTLETTPHSAGVREYLPGDPLKRIHWRTTARKDHLMVKEFDQDPQADVWIFMDSQKGIHTLIEEDAVPKTERFWLWRQKYEFKLPPNTYEYATSIAASTAGFFLREGQSVGFISEGQILTALMAERGERQFEKILETLAFLKPEGELPLLGIVEAQAGNMPRGSIAVIITPSTDTKILQVVDSLAIRKLRPIVILFDSSSFGGTGDPESLALSLRTRKIPVTIIRKDADLKRSLENGFS
jgi:uncharacterized protein (DUF58 family)